MVNVCSILFSLKISKIVGFWSEKAGWFLGSGLKQSARGDILATWNLSNNSDILRIMG